MSSLTPRVFLIEQDVNAHTYFIQRFNLSGTWRWFIVLKINDIRNCSTSPGLAKGFDTPEEALETWKQHYEPETQPS